MLDSKLIGSVEAAKILGVDPSTITRWVEKKRLTPADRWPHGRYGAFLFSRAQVEQLAEDRAARRAS